MSDNTNDVNQETSRKTQKGPAEGTVLPSGRVIKTRKGQTEEQYFQQKKQFFATGPLLNTEDWLANEEDWKTLDNDKKTDRIRMINACERAYYQRDYRKCMDLIAATEKLFGVDLNDEESNERTKDEFETLGRKTKKSAKVERHVVDLMHIKERCLRQLEGQ